MEHVGTETLTAQLPYFRSAPRDEGTVLLIVRRPAVDEREVLQTGELDPAVGLVGDTWNGRSSKRTADGGAEITKLVGTSAWYAPGSAAAEMVEAILKDKKKILPCSVFLQGEYGIQDLFVGVPVKLGARGVEQIIQIKLTPDEDAALKKSAGAVKELVDVIKV